MIGRSPIPKNLVNPKGSLKLRSLTTDMLMKEYRRVTSPMVRNGLLLPKLFMIYALENSMPRRVVKTRVKLRIKPLGVNDKAFLPKPVKKPIFMRMIIKKIATLAAAMDTCLLNHDFILLKPHAFSVTRARKPQHAEGRTYAIMPPGRSVFKIM